MSTALVFYTNGTEDIEVTATVDVLDRGGVKITKAAVTEDGSKTVTLAHGSVVTTEKHINDITDTYDLIVVPGGAGVKNFAKSQKLLALLKEQKEAGRLIGAICAAPGVVLYANGLITTEKATCYPGCECGGQFLTDGVVTTEDNLLVTGRGPGFAVAFGLELLKVLEGQEKANAVAKGMLVD